MKKTNVAFLILALLCISTAAMAQKKEERKYSARAAEVDEEIMGKPDPMFASNAIPEAFSHSSAVIIAKKVDLYSDFVKKVKHGDYKVKSLSSNTTRYHLTIREKIKIMDKNALSEFSEISFSKIRKQSNFFKRTAFFFLGIRLIKADGNVKIINVDEEAVNASTEDEKEKYKLAVPGLEVGDIVDMYARVEQESPSDKPIDPLDIMLGGEYPQVKYSLNVKVQNEFGIIYTLSNGAPEIVKSDDGDFIYLKMELENVNQTPDHPWLYERRELPVIKVNILPGTDVYSTDAFALKQGQVLKELPKGWVDNYFTTRLINLYWPKPSERLKKFKEYLSLATNGNERMISEDSLIQYIYYYSRYAYLYDNLWEETVEAGVDRNSSSVTYAFLEFLLEALNSYAIEYEFICTVPGNSGTIYNAVSPSEFFPIIRTMTGKKNYCLVPPDMFSSVGSFSYSFEGQDAYVFKDVQYIKKGYHSEIQKMPVTKPLSNFVGEDLVVSINAEKPQQLDIKRICTQRGNMAYDDKVRLLLFEDYVDKEREQFDGQPFLEELKRRTGKKGNQLATEYKEAYTEARKKRLEYAQKEVESTYETKPVVPDSFRILKTGNRHYQPDFVFAENFSLDGVLKKAGPNYILEMGSLMTDQLQIKPEQRKRPYNVYMSFARTYEYKINLAIPKGYSVQGLENLQKNIVNESGSFVSSASVDNGKLLIKATKTYNHNYEEAGNWDKMLEFIDAAYNFSQEKILLKKD